MLPEQKVLDFVADGYRTAETQQQILEGKIEAYKNEGYSSEEAEKKAKRNGLLFPERVNIN